MASSAARPGCAQAVFNLKRLTDTGAHQAKNGESPAAPRPGSIHGPNRSSDVEVACALKEIHESRKSQLLNETLPATPVVYRDFIDNHLGASESQGMAVGTIDYDGYYNVAIDLHCLLRCFSSCCERPEAQHRDETNFDLSVVLSCLCHLELRTRSNPKAEVHVDNNIHPSVLMK
jgi:hypothetical protein